MLMPEYLRHLPGRTSALPKPAKTYFLEAVEAPACIRTAAIPRELSGLVNSCATSDAISWHRARYVRANRRPKRSRNQKNVFASGTVRRRIATDLHDDRIEPDADFDHEQVAQEIARRRERALSMIATLRRTIDAMSDIVWAINPQRITERSQAKNAPVRRCLTAHNIELDFRAP